MCDEDKPIIFLSLQLQKSGSNATKAEIKFHQQPKVLAKQLTYELGKLKNGATHSRRENAAGYERNLDLYHVGSEARVGIPPPHHPRSRLRSRRVAIKGQRITDVPKLVALESFRKGTRID